MISIFPEWIWKPNRNETQTHGPSAGQLQVGFVVIPITQKGGKALFTPARHENTPHPSPSALRARARRCAVRTRRAHELFATSTVASRRRVAATSPLISLTQ